jgi:hypothetical protein
MIFMSNLRGPLTDQGKRLPSYPKLRNPQKSWPSVPSGRFRIRARSLKLVVLDIDTGPTCF